MSRLSPKKKAPRKRERLGFYAETDVVSDVVRNSLGRARVRTESRPQNAIWWFSPKTFMSDDGKAKELIELAEKNNCRLNFFPGVYHCMKKCKLASLINLWRQLQGGDKYYNFAPKQYVMPRDLLKFKNQLAQNVSKGWEKVYIHKPDGGRSGKGISLISSVESLQNKEEENALVQEYIDRPLLLDNGLKFDIRIYVYIESLEPLKVFVCREAMCRFCTVKYEHPDEGNISNARMHLTNFGINRRTTVNLSEGGYLGELRGLKDPPREGTSGDTKRTLSEVFGNLSVQGYDVETLWEKICCLISHSCATMQPHLNQKYRSLSDPPKHGEPTCFHILGFDVLIAEERHGNEKCTLKPYLMEINANPSLKTEFRIYSDGMASSVESRVDTLIKEKVLEGCLLLASRASTNPSYFQEILFDNESNKILRIGSLMRSIFEHLRAFKKSGILDIQTFHRFYSIARTFTTSDGMWTTGQEPKSITSAEIVSVCSKLENQSHGLDFDAFCELFFAMLKINKINSKAEVEQTLTSIMSCIDAMKVQSNPGNGGDGKSLGHFLLLEHKRSQRLQLRQQEKESEKIKERQAKERRNEAKMRWEKVEQEKRAQKAQQKLLLAEEKRKKSMLHNKLQEKKRRQNEAAAWLEKRRASPKKSDQHNYPS